MYNNWGSAPLVSKYVTWETYKSIQDSIDFLKFIEESYNEDNTYQWLVVLKEDNTTIGTISGVNVNEKHNTVEIGYCYGRKWWGKGILRNIILDKDKKMEDIASYSITKEDYLKNK